ncbi:MAG: 30S ribosomal protein S9 [Candidatus Pelagibacter sp. TMED196]|nr:MAG: 30S ribosomal protein S9 [Candidatus Pelagibacter sp. TMED196]|tara:strand:+ start:2432 stop:2878 length:447 start_codon:yes stop_codon:yes gene_type:complete
MNNPTAQTTDKKFEKIKLDFKDSKYATGRRKKSIARVWVKKGSGKIYVNGKQMQEYFKRPVHQILVVRPLNEINASADYDVKCRVTGGGLSGQAGAIIHGLSRALVRIDGNLKKTLKKNKLVTRDSRKVERKKYGRKKARRSFQFSKR